MEYENIRRKVKDNIIDKVRNNELDEAEVLIDNYMAKVTNDCEIYSILANIYLKRDNVDRAEKVLREALKIDSNNLIVMYNLANLYKSTKLKCLPLALNYYKRCLKVSENSKLEIESSIEEIEKGLTLFKEENKPLVSIIVVAHKDLKYTKLCIESIYKYTLNIKFELITVNNGSIDGSEGYFNTLPNDKKIKMINDVGFVDGFNAGIEYAEGKYLVAIENDFILTQNWINNLLTCIESDETIGLVAPGSNIIANYQRIECHYKSIDDMKEFAKNYNESNPKKWEERIRLLQSVFLGRTDVLKSIGGYDPRFYNGVLADDDLSIMVRRAGYKLVYAGDTFVHRTGSATIPIGKEELKSTFSEASKEIFIKKYGMDNYVEVSYNPQIVSFFDHKFKDNIEILGINTFCGGTTLQIKNKLKSIGAESIKIVNVTEDEKYVEDLKTVSDEVYYTPIENMRNFINFRKFDFIIYEAGIDNVNNFNDTILTLKECLREGGQLIFTMNNRAYYGNLFYADDYEQNLYGDEYKISYLNPSKVIEILSNNKFTNIKNDRLIPFYREDTVENLLKSISLGGLQTNKLNIITTKIIISCEM